MSSLAPPHEFARRWTVWSKLRFAFYGVLSLAGLYLVSIGPMSPLLCHHGGEHGYRIWQAVYGKPLGNLPKPCRNAVNAYLSASERVYWRIHGR